MSRKSKKLDPSRIIGHIDDRALRQFITRYAERDPDFLYRLWVRFAGVVEFRDDRDKYDYLFFRILHQYLASSVNPTKKRIRQLRYLYSELAGHAADAIGMERYQEAFFIIRPGIIYGKLAFRRSESKDSEGLLLEQYLEFHRLLGQLINRMLPPPLVEKIASFCMEESMVYDYYLADVEFNLFALAFRLIYEAETAEEYLENISENFAQIQKNSASSIYIKQIAVAEAYKWDKEEYWREWYDRGLLKQEEITALANLFYTEDRLELTYRFANTMVNEVGMLPRRHLLAILIKSWDKDKDPKTLQSAVHSYLETDGDMKPLYDVLSKKDMNSALRSRLFGGVQNFLTEKEEAVSLYDWAILRGDYDNFLNMVEESGDVRFLLERLSDLPEDKHERGCDIISAWLRERLNKSYGKQGSLFLQEVVHDLRKQGLDNMAEDVLDFVRDHFPKRRSIQGVI